MARILLLEDRRSAGDGELDRYLSTPIAACAGARPWRPDASATPARCAALVTLMNDGEPEVRQMTAFALGLDRRPTRGGALSFALADAEPIVRARAAEALGRIGDARAASPSWSSVIRRPLPTDAPVLTVRGDDPGSARDPWLGAAPGLFALCAPQGRAPRRSPCWWTGASSRFDWWAATWTAMRLESPGLQARCCWRPRPPPTRSLARLAARGLGALKDRGASTRSRPLAARPGRQASSSARCARSGCCGDAPGRPAGGRAPGSSASALRCARRRCWPWPRCLRTARLRAARGRARSGTRSPGVRGAALQALARIDREEFALVLSGLDPDPAWSVRAALATALGIAGDEVSQARSCYAMLKDDDVRVLPVVLEALRKARGARLRGHAAPPPRASGPRRARGRRRRGPGRLKVTGRSRAAAARRLLAALPRRRRPGRALGRGGRARHAEGRATPRPRCEEIAAGDPARRPCAGVAAREAARPRRDGARAGRRARARARRSTTARPWRPTTRPAGSSLYTPRAILHTRQGRIEIHLDIVEAPLTSAVLRRPRAARLLRRPHVPSRGPGLRGPGRRSARRRQRRARLHAALRARASGPTAAGAVGMALSGKDTGGSQFFITLAPAPHLDGGATRCSAGWRRGMDVVDKIRPGDVIEKVEIWTGR